jgi:hypothetical protein
VQKAVSHDGPFYRSVSATKRIGFTKKTNQRAVNRYPGHGECRNVLETEWLAAPTVLPPQKYVPLLVGSSAGWTLEPSRTRRDGGIRIGNQISVDDARAVSGWALANRRMAVYYVTNALV